MLQNNIDFRRVFMKKFSNLAGILAIAATFLAAFDNIAAAESFEIYIQQAQRFESAANMCQGLEAKYYLLYKARNCILSFRSEIQNQIQRYDQMLSYLASEISKQPTFARFSDGTPMDAFAAYEQDCNFWIDSANRSIEYYKKMLDKYQREGDYFNIRRCQEHIQLMNKHIQIRKLLLEKRKVFENDMQKARSFLKEGN